MMLHNMPFVVGRAVLNAGHLNCRNITAAAGYAPSLFRQILRPPWKLYTLDVARTVRTTQKRFFCWADLRHSRVGLTGPSSHGVRNLFSTRTFCRRCASSATEGESRLWRKGLPTEELLPLVGALVITNKGLANTLLIHDTSSTCNVSPPGGPVVC